MQLLIADNCGFVWLPQNIRGWKVKK